MYHIKLSQFEGPLDLLLQLIEKRKLSINEISLAEITDQYLDYLNRLDDFPVEEAAYFAVIASTLLLIKSRSLTPSLELTPEEEESIEDLEERLRVYRRIKDLAGLIKEAFGKKPIFRREEKGSSLFRSFYKPGEEFLEPKGLSLDVLASSMRGIIESLPKKEKLPEAEVKKIIRLEEKIEELISRIQNAMELSFNEFSVSRDDIGKEHKKTEIIISFLAMLELVKRGVIMVRQEALFDSIKIYKGYE